MTSSVQDLAPMKRILVTGGAGFIGSNFIQYMLSTYEDIEILNLDKLTYAGNLDNLCSVQSDPRYTFRQGDIADKSMVQVLLDQIEVDAVVNFAAETHVDRSISKPDEFLRTDIFGTFSLLEAVRNHDIKRFVHISTDEVYGPAIDGEMTEVSALNPSSPYSASKGGGDLMCRAYYTTYGTPVMVTRAANNYGAYQYPEKFIPLFITNALEDQELPLYGDGKQVREWLHVADHCKAVDLVLRRGQAGEFYNIGGFGDEENVSIARRILELTKKDESLLKFVEDRPGHDVRYALDCTKIRELGWEPEMSVDEGLARTVTWYKKNKSWWKKLKNDEFKQYYKNQYGERLANARRTA